MCLVVFFIGIEILKHVYHFTHYKIPVSLLLSLFYDINSCIRLFTNKDFEVRTKKISLKKIYVYNVFVHTKYRHIGGNFSLVFEENHVFKNDVFAYNFSTACRCKCMEWQKPKVEFETFSLLAKIFGYMRIKKIFLNIYKFKFSNYNIKSLIP